LQAVPSSISQILFPQGCPEFKEVDHTTVIHWVKQMPEFLPDTRESTEIPEVTQLDELEFFDDFTDGEPLY